MTTRNATPEQYADLVRELEGAPFGYRLRIYTRYQADFGVERRKALDKIGSGK